MTERPNIRRGDVVEVDEEHRRPWIGVVGSVKPTKKGWWIEVADDGSMTYTVPSEAVSVIEREEVTDEGTREVSVDLSSRARGGGPDRLRRGAEAVLTEPRMRPRSGRPW